ncbi:MAG: hypothetical protein HY080_14735 [Gammaproteobacteria bacterium]|nr:hypothetical protein [Gammaproteobacteria bacterium]
MSPADLLRAIEEFLAAPEPAALPVLIQSSVDLADMVGWAAGPIDPQGQLHTRILSLLDRLRTRYATQSDASLAALHDALGTLGDAIARHDRDLSSEQDPDDEETY